jgi:predicted small lipoprotein YifL
MTMKQLLALLLAAMILLSLAACGGNGDTNKPNAPKANLKTFEMTCEPDGVEEPAKATVGYPKNFTMEQQDWCVVLTDESKDAEIEVFMTNDYNCYDVNQEYAKAEYFFYEEATFGGFEGYACMTDEESATVEVYVYLGLVAEMDDVYMTFYISSASMDLDADPQALYKLPEVRQVLDSVVYTAPAEPAD